MKSENKVNFTKNEISFLKKQKLCRLATSSDDQPHVVPVNYMFYKGAFFIAVDYNTKKYRNITKNKKVALVIDTVKPKKAIMINGEAEIIEKGRGFNEIYKIFYENFQWVRDYPWKAGEAPFLKIVPGKKATLGFKS